MQLTHPFTNLRRLVLLGMVAIAAMAWPAAAQMLSASSLVQLRGVVNQSALVAGEDAELAVVMVIADGYHAQSNKPSSDTFIPTVLTVDAHPNLTFGNVRYPPGKVKTYPALGTMNLYDGQAVLRVPVSVAASAAAGPITITGMVTVQVCDDQQCLFPEDLPFVIETEILPPGSAVSPANGEIFDQAEAVVYSTGSLSDYAKYLAIALGAGVLLNIVPCVLPVLPIKALSFYESAQHSRGRSVLMGTFFSLGIIATFLALAVPVVVLRVLDWGQMFSNPWFAGGITLIMLGFGLGMFGLFDVVLPNSVYNYTPKHDTLTGNFGFGILTAVLSTPCTFGPLALVIGWAATQPSLGGLSVLGTVGAGMALPYLLLSGFPELARKFPRAGAWSNVFKQTMGFWMLAAAVFFGQAFLPENWSEKVAWVAMYALIIGSGIFLLVRTIQIARNNRPVLIGGTVFSVLLIAVSGAMGSSLLKPDYPWQTYTPETLAEARATGKTVVLKFTATWCGNCHAIERLVYNDDDTRAALAERNIVSLKADLTQRDAVGWALLRDLNAVGSIPFTAVYHDGDEKPIGLTGIYNETELLRTIDGQLGEQ